MDERFEECRCNENWRLVRTWYYRNIVPTGDAGCRLDMEKRAESARGPVCPVSPLGLLALFYIYGRLPTMSPSVARAREADFELFTADNYGSFMNTADSEVYPQQLSA